MDLSARASKYLEFLAGRAAPAMGRSPAWPGCFCVRDTKTTSTMLRFTALALAVPTAHAQCGPGGANPYPPGTSTCPAGPSGGAPPGGAGGGGGAACVGQPCYASLLGDVGVTTVAGSDTRSGDMFPIGENIYGPFEAGFTAAQNNILEALGCSDGNLGHLPGGIDTNTAEQMVAHQCSISLPRCSSGTALDLTNLRLNACPTADSYISLLDECGGHTNEYHFHERLVSFLNIKNDIFAFKMVNFASNEMMNLH